MGLTSITFPVFHSGIVSIATPSTLYNTLKYHVYTIFLFTISDIKTVLLPVSIFACATAPLHSPGHFLTGLAWLYLHQLMCNVSNQARTGDEDSANKPWRPLPTGRLTEAQAVALRWAVAVLCVCASSAFGYDVAATSAATVLVTFVYDELGFSDHYIGKNLCNIGGYTMLEIGTTKLMGVSPHLDATATTAICISGVLIFTTIQTQDFADVVGDQAKGRVTFPIYAPEASRVATLIAMTSWSLILPVFWGIGPLFSAVILALGGFIGMRYFVFRTPEQDKFSYILYNIWLMGVHILPLHRRIGAFAM